jgi:hypothetical protein
MCNIFVRYSKSEVFNLTPAPLLWRGEIPHPKLLSKGEGGRNSPYQEQKNKEIFALLCNIFVRCSKSEVLTSPPAPLQRRGEIPHPKPLSKGEEGEKLTL